MSFLPPIPTTSGGFPVVPDTVYTAPGAITVANTFALLQPDSSYNEGAPMAMTLPNGTVGKSMLIKLDGPGAATVTGNFDRQSGATISLFSPNGRGALWVLWNIAAATWYVMDQFDPGKLRSDLPSAGVLTTADLSDITRAGIDGKTTLGDMAQLVLAQSLPTLALTGTTTLSFAVHNKRRLYCSSSLTLVVPSAATLGEGFTTTISALGTSTVSLSGTVVDLAGTSVIAIPGSSSATLEVCSGVIYCDRRLGSAVSTNALVITGISGQNPGGTSAASLSFTGGAPATLTATLDGVSLAIAAVTITTTSGSGATAVGTASFTFTTPSAGTHAIVASSTGAYSAQSNTFTLITSTSPVIAVTSVTPVGVGVVNATANGSFSGGLPASLTATMDGGALTIASPSIVTVSGSGATAAGTFSFTFTNPAAGAHLLVVTSTGTYAATSVAYAYSTAAATLSVNTVTPPAPNAPLTIGGSFSNWLPAGLQYSLDSTNGIDGFWTTASSPTIGSNTYVFTIAGGVAAGAYTLWVRGVTNTQITASSNSFTVIAASGSIAAPTGTTINTPASFVVTVTGTGSPTVYASVTSGGTEQTPRTAVAFGSTSVSLTPTVAAASTASLYLASSGGSALATSGSFTPAAGSTYPVLTTPAAAYVAIYDASIGVTSASGVMSAWADQSGNAHNLASTIGVSVGAQVNGMPTLLGTSTLLASNSGAIAANASPWLLDMGGNTTIMLTFRTGSALVDGIVLDFEINPTPSFSDHFVWYIQNSSTSPELVIVRGGRATSDSTTIVQTVGRFGLVANTLYKVGVRWTTGVVGSTVASLNLSLNGTTVGTYNDIHPSTSTLFYYMRLLQKASNNAPIAAFQGLTQTRLCQVHLIKGYLSDADLAAQFTHMGRWG